MTDVLKQRWRVGEVQGSGVSFGWDIFAEDRAFIVCARTAEVAQHIVDLHNSSLDADARIPDFSDVMIVCPDCGNKRCPRASDHRLACARSNEPGQPGSVYGHPPAGGK